MAQRNRKDWRELCTAVANETDSNQLGSLVQELIRALDERDQNWRSPIDPFPDRSIAQRSWRDFGDTPESLAHAWAWLVTAQFVHATARLGAAVIVFGFWGCSHPGSSFNLGFPDWEK
jgi:hypothetical protein